MTDKPSKRPWRTLLRVHDDPFVDDKVKFYVPSYSRRPIRVNLSVIPDDVITAIKSGIKYYYARVNIGAFRARDLKFEPPWEIGTR